MKDEWVYLGGGLSCLACGGMVPGYAPNTSSGGHFLVSDKCNPCETCGAQWPTKIRQSSFRFAVKVRDAALTAKEKGIDATTVALRRFETRKAQLHATYP